MKSFGKLLSVICLVITASLAAFLSGCGGGGGGSLPSTGFQGGTTGKVAASVTLTGRVAGRQAAQSATATVKVNIAITGVYSKNNTPFGPITASLTVDLAKGSGEVDVVNVPIGVNHLLTAAADWGGAVETVKAIIPAVKANELTTVTGDEESTVVAEAAILHAERNKTTLDKVSPEKINEIKSAVSALSAIIPLSQMTADEALEYVEAAASAASVAISPASAAVTAGGSQQFTATVTDANGASVSGAAVAWSFAPSDVGSISAGGLFTAASAAGSGVVTASFAGLTATASVTVSYACVTDADCDDGNPQTADVCDNAGTASAVCGNNMPVCGNSAVEYGETCDDGNTVTETCTYGQTSCTVCNSSCASAAGATTYCGDGATNGSETCDDGANNGQPNYCNATCNGTAGAATFNVSGCVFDGSPGTPLPGAAVSADSGGSVTADASGCYVISNLPAGSVTLAATKSGYPTSTQTVTSPGNETITGVNFTLTATSAVCGNSVVESGETCDDGNTATETCTYGQTSCTVCNSTCQSAAGAASYCGDSTTQSGNSETCDDGNTTTETCTYGQTSCAVCNATCQSAAGATSYCGDSTTQSGNSETCDDGNTTTETCAYGQTSCTVCNSSCASAAGATSYCGDSTTQSGNGETCDDGNTAGGDGCSAACATETIVTNAWITIPAGDFVMGCATADGGCFSQESPKHTVTLSQYKIQKYEVTNAQYKACVDAAACAAPSNSSSSTRGSYYGNATYDNYPVIYVDWNKAGAYCSWIGGRLPTEAEWEKAARGPYPAEPLYPWGDGAATCTLAEYWNSCTGDTAEVGSHPTGASYYGVMDMAGNVWNWVNDWYDATYYTTGGPPWTDPQGPVSGSYRVLRGGSWTSDASTMRASIRGSSSPANADVNIGFRCAQGALCGNGTVETGETCDDGNFTTESCTYGQTSCSVCNASCQNAAGATSYCGDSITDAGNSETCDDGNTAGGDGCSATCQTESISWMTKTSMTIARYAPAAAVVNGKLYIIGGSGGADHKVDNEEYDILTDTWSTKASMPTGRQQVAVGVINNKIYVAGGNSGGDVAALEVYDPSLNTWTTKTSMPLARNYPGAGGAVVNGKLYVFGGSTAGVGVTDSTVKEYDPILDTWTTKSSMPTMRAGNAVAVNGKVYFIGGCASGSSAGMDNVEEYNPTTDTWAIKAPMTTPRCSMATAVVNGKIYVIGGSSSGVALNVVEVYDPVANTWASEGTAITARGEAGTGVFNNKIYIVGGINALSVVIATNEEMTIP